MVMFDTYWYPIKMNFFFCVNDILHDTNDKNSSDHLVVGSVYIWHRLGEIVWWLKLIFYYLMIDKRVF